MRVVIRPALIIVAALLLLQIASDVWPQASTTIAGIGYIDYRNKPRFKVGDWVKYHFSSTMDGGKSEDYDLQILISGEEVFWGDRCFWVETVAGGRTLPTQANALLMSYSIFGDTAWLAHLQLYQRKRSSVGESGEPRQELVRRVMGRSAKSDRPSLTVVTDTMGTESIDLAAGAFKCVKVGRKAGAGTVDEKGDSTFRFENWDRRTLYLSPKVPMTSLVREVDERWITRKAWKVGKSADAVQSYRLKGTGTLDLVAWGSGGVPARLTPLYARRNLPASPAKPVKRSVRKS